MQPTAQDVSADGMTADATGIDASGTDHRELSGDVSLKFPVATPFRPSGPMGQAGTGYAVADVASCLAAFGSPVPVDLHLLQQPAATAEAAGGWWCEREDIEQGGRKDDRRWRNTLQLGQAWRGDGKENGVVKAHRTPSPSLQARVSNAVIGSPSALGVLSLLRLLCVRGTAAGA